jgi:hypothetical protein
MDKFWINKDYKLSPPVVITEQILNIYVNLFWKEVMSKIKNDQHVLLLLKVKFEDNQIRTLSELQTINNNNSLRDNLLQFFKDRLQILNEAYRIIPVSHIIFSYGIRSGAITHPTIGPIQNKNKKITYQIYYRNELPIAMVPEDYGSILSKLDNFYTILVHRGVQNAIITLTIKTDPDNKIVNHINYIKNNNLLFSWTDTIISLEEKKFIRRIGKSIIHYENGEISLFTTIKKTSPIVPKKLRKNISLKNKFITMDLETITHNNILIPYLLCWSDGKRKKSYFITHPTEIVDFINGGNIENYILAMIKDAMKDICIRKYKGYRIYLHNFAKFDGYFLIKYLNMLGRCNPIIHKGRIISTKFRLFENNYNVTFLDSYLMLPSSLKDLSKSFNLEMKKSIFL